LGELCLLGQAQYFLDTFYVWAATFGVKSFPCMISPLSCTFGHLQCNLVEIRWNFADAFVGCATNVAPAPPAGTLDKRNLIFLMFLAAPLLNTSNMEEWKFLDNEEIALITDTLGRVVDAYVHHALVNSFGDVLLVDIQDKIFELRF
jgi:hypothetical protein